LASGRRFRSRDARSTSPRQSRRSPPPSGRPGRPPVRVRGSRSVNSSSIRPTASGRSSLSRIRRWPGSASSCS
jgi:hypothetical protein